MKFKIISQRLEFKNIFVLSKFDMRFHEFILFRNIHTYVCIYVYVHMYVHKRPTKCYAGNQIKETEMGGALVHIRYMGRA